jgi:ABC-type hemin transport system ATPase subunit
MFISSVSLQTYTVPDSYGRFFCRKTDPKLILKRVSGMFKSGELTAIMGPSGAGENFRFGDFQSGKRKVVSQFSYKLRKINLKVR